jgi:hypothetical protein
MATLYEADVTRFVTDLDPVVEWLTRRGRVPADAAVVPIGECHVEPVLRLHAAFACPPEIARARLLGVGVGVGVAREASYCRMRSVVLLVHGEVRGAVLVQDSPLPATAFIYAVVVDTGWRRTWAAAFLKHRAAARLRDLGTVVVRFQVDDGIRDTHKHARRVQARTIVDLDLSTAGIR